MATMSNEESVDLTQHRLALELRTDPVKGRGVFTREKIAANTLVEISPILLFNDQEYASHGKYTVLDHYTYCWPGGYALALGLGSMFNHHSIPNVGFIRDFPNKLIRYVTLREIEPEEELCISYGNHLWFEVDSSTAPPVISDSEEELFPFQDSSDDDDGDGDKQ